MRSMSQTAWLQDLHCMLRVRMQWGQVVILVWGSLRIDEPGCNDEDEVLAMHRELTSQ